MAEQKKERFATLRQMKQVYDFTKQYDSSITALLAVAWLTPIIIAVILGVVLQPTWLGWIMYCFSGIVGGLILGILVLTQRTDATVYKQLEGKEGAAGMVASRITNSGFSFPQEPIWLDPKTHDMIWRGTGRTGIYLIAEGNEQRLDSALKKEIVKIRRITPGSNIPVMNFIVGDALDSAAETKKLLAQGKPAHVTLRKLKSRVLRQKIVLTKVELDQLNARLRTLSTKSTAGVPKGIDPSKLHVNRRAFRTKG